VTQLKINTLGALFSKKMANFETWNGKTITIRGARRSSLHNSSMNRINKKKPEQD